MYASAQKYVGRSCTPYKPYLSLHDTLVLCAVLGTLGKRPPKKACFVIPSKGGPTILLADFPVKGVEHTPLTGENLIRSILQLL